MRSASAQVTGFGYEHDEAWLANMELFKEFTDVSRGVRRLGAAAVDLCHVALGGCLGWCRCSHLFRLMLLPFCCILCGKPTTEVIQESKILILV